MQIGFTFDPDSIAVVRDHDRVFVSFCFEFPSVEAARAGADMLTENVKKSIIQTGAGFVETDLGDDHGSLN